MLAAPEITSPVTSTAVETADPTAEAALPTTLAAAQMTQAHQYVVMSSATDSATNVQSVLSTASFTYDMIVPTATVTTPAVAYVDGSFVTVAGTANDSPAGISTLQVAISSANGVSGWWTGGSDFQGQQAVYHDTATYVPGSPDGWTFTVPTLTNGKSYLLQTRAVDRAGNTRVQQHINFLFDSGEPTTTITDPVSGLGKNSIFTIAGTSGGIFMDCSVHDIDLARWMLGSPRALRAYASMTTSAAHGAVRKI